VRPVDGTAVEDLLRTLAPQVLGALTRRYGHFDVAEDAVQEALITAVTQWTVHGVPEGPQAWLIRVASRRMIDLLRSDDARRRREVTATRPSPADEPVVPDEDDSLVLLFLCCHPALTSPSQVALTLRAVGGLTTTEIAAAFLVPETTMGQRISRAKQQIKRSGTPFRLPGPGERAARLEAVCQVLYLIFNQGYADSTGEGLLRVELSAEAIRLTRMLHRTLPGDGEVAGLLALMLLTDARRPARTGADGALIPMAEQDRGAWDRQAIAEGVELVTAAMSRSALGPYQVQAAIAAVHDEAPSAAETDWPQILGLYEVLETLTDNPVVRLNRTVALAMVYGPRAGLAALRALDGDAAFAGNHRPAAVRAHLLERAGELDAAAAEYRTAARFTTSIPEQRYLRARAARVTPS
jgi:RNA polymerase sigma factor (sigma-70 family)